MSLEPMTLKELINFLEEKAKEDPDRVVFFGIGNPHSYRGDYADLAFEPKKDVTVAKMLSDALSCVGREFTGWKGGMFTMLEHTDVWLANWGSEGTSLSQFVLELMFDK